MAHPSLTIRRLAPELKEDFLRYFEGAAFVDNPKWKSCDCQFLCVDHSEPVGRILCLVVAREHRRTGIARTPLEEACAMQRDQGHWLGEATPLRDAGSDAENHW